MGRRRVSVDSDGSMPSTSPTARRRSPMPRCEVKSRGSSDFAATDLAWPWTPRPEPRGKSHDPDTPDPDSPARHLLAIQFSAATLLVETAPSADVASDALARVDTANRSRATVTTNFAYNADRQHCDVEAGPTADSSSGGNLACDDASRTNSYNGSTRSSSPTTAKATGPRSPRRALPARSPPASSATRATRSSRRS